MASQSVLDQLSSRLGERGGQSNRKVAGLCLAEPALLEEIAEGLGSADGALAGDCAEVMTMVADEQSGLVAPYAERLAPLLGHRTTRVRWEATHAVALAAASRPDLIGQLLPTLAEAIRSDKSTIVRDYATDAVGAYAGTSPAAASGAYRVLVEALTAWDGKQAGHALHGLAGAAALLPARRAELRAIAEEHVADSSATIRKAARQLLRATGS
jgi:HPt (histidine-containing phosphotransfer) domain-containing protein